jgi:OOP family OmpA-OmpF porin
MAPALALMLALAGVGIPEKAAAVDDRNGLFLDIGYGIYKEDSDLTETLFVNGSTSDNNYGIRIYGGFQFNDWFALEAGFVDMSHIRYTTPNGNIDVEPDGYHIKAIASFPISRDRNGFTGPFISVGAWRWDAEIVPDATVTAALPAVVKSRVHDTDATASLGVMFRSKTTAVRLEYERFRTQILQTTTDFDLISINLVFY